MKPPLGVPHPVNYAAPTDHAGLSDKLLANTDRAQDVEESVEHRGRGLRRREQTDTGQLGFGHAHDPSLGNVTFALILFILPLTRPSAQAYSVSLPMRWRWTNQHWLMRRA